MVEFSLKNISADLIDNVMMKTIATRGIIIIRRRTQEGKFLQGNSSYSTKPFAMPWGALTKTLQGKIDKSEMPSAYQPFTTKSGATWLIIHGGYKQLRSKAGKQSSHVDLHWSARMMRNLGVIAGDQKSSTLGFTSEDEKKKAEWHNKLGAGKSKAIHKFMGFTNKEIDQLSEFADALIVKKILKSIK